MNPLESVLSELLISTPISIQASGSPGNGGSIPTVSAANMTVLLANGDFFVPLLGQSLPVTASTTAVASVSNMLTFPLGSSVAAPGLPVSGGNSFVNISGAGQGPTMQHQLPSLLPSTGNQTRQQFTSVAGPSSNQVRFIGQLSQVITQQSLQGFPSTSIVQTSQPVSTPANEPMHTFQRLSKSTNPFDFSSESSPVQAPTFPSMVSLPGALPNKLPQSGLMCTSSLSTPLSSYTPALRPHAPSDASAMPPAPRAYKGQQVVSNIPLSRHQGVGSIGAEGIAFGFSSVDHQLAGRFSVPTTQSPFSSGGRNPFG